MNKKEIAEKIYKKLDIKRFEAYNFIDLFIETVAENLNNGNKVVISNFGTLKVVQRQNKRVINPNDNKPMIIPAQRIVKFFPSKKLKDLVMRRK
jgi:nucleoid DNA-binding protein